MILATAWPPVRLTALLLLAACQPEARRLLLLDLALSDPLVLESTARPWRDAGYAVHYRRYYPHLTWADLASYRTLLFLGGREPEQPSDRLTAGDLALLSEWVTRGGVAVFGYSGDGEGFYDRWVMNRWLASHGAGLVIGDYALHDTTRAPAGAFEPQPPVVPRRPAPLHDPGHEPFPAGRNHVLLVDSDRQVVARSTAAAFVHPPGREPEPRPRAAVMAASRVGSGLVVIASRHALATPGPELRAATEPPLRAGTTGAAQRFLRALARWTRRPAEWASVPPARQREPLELREAPLPVSSRPPRLDPPQGVETIALSRPPSHVEARAAQPPSWMAQQGMRVFWGDLQSAAAFQPASPRARELDSLIGFLEAGAFNGLAMDAQIAAGGDTARFPSWEREYAAAVRRQLVERLQTSSLRWIPVIRLPRLRVPVDTPARGIRGDSLALWCALGPDLWNAALAPAYRSVARLAAELPELVPAVALDLSLPERAGYTMGHDYCDATYRAALGAMGLDSARLVALGGLPVEARYEVLLDAGLLGGYYAALERLVAARAAVLRRETRAFAPALAFAFRSDPPPVTWFALGLLTGFSGGGPPVLLWTREPHAGALTATFRARGVPVLHGTGIAPAALGASAWPRLRRAVFEESDGFWVSGERDAMRAAGDSLARLIRRLSR